VKAILTIFFAAVFAANAQQWAPPPRTAQQQEAYEFNFVPKDPWRVFGGETNYVRKDGKQFCGKVLQAAVGGVRVMGGYGELFHIRYFNYVEDYDRNTEFFVANFPYTIAEDEVIPTSSHMMAYYVGTYTYTTVQGASRTIRKLDYGIPCDEPEYVKQAKLEVAAKLKVQQILATSEARQNKEAQDLRTFLRLQSQATNGEVWAQSSLGLHYLNGQGCETNRELAIKWLKMAAGNGDMEASNKLERLKQ